MTDPSRALRKGLFLTFEGIDGAGKSTHIQALAEAFAASGREVVTTREPGGTPLGEKLRTLALNDPMDPLTEALLMFAARREHLVQVIEPALARGQVVLCDRFTDATFAYQGGGRGFDWQVLGQLEAMVQGRGGEGGLRQPDLTWLFELDPAEAARRLAGARVPDKFESQPAAFFQQVQEGYLRRAQETPARFARIDAARSREAVWEAVRAAASGRGWL
jgi:dTMP kinase